MAARLLTVSLLLSLFIASCSKEADYISSIPASENPYLLATDTFSATATIYRPDSIVTSGKSKLLMGRHKGDVFGTIACTPYFRLNVPTDMPSFASNSYFDSIVLILRVSNMWYGDTNAAIGINVFRLSENIETVNTAMYSHEGFQTYPDMLGSKTTVIKPAVDDSINIKLSATLGKELFDLCKSGSSYTSNNENFQDYFKGLSIVPSANSNIIYAFANADSAIQVRIFYHEDNGRSESRQFNFGIDNSLYSFYHMDINRAGTSIAALDQSSSIAAGSMILNQEITGIRTRINFPYLKELLKTGNTVKVISAQMEVKPVFARYTVLYQLPPTLNLYYYQTSGALYGPVTYPGSTSDPQTGDLYVDVNFGKETSWKFDVTDFVNAEIASSNYTHLEPTIIFPNSDNDLATLVATMPAGSNTSRLIITSLVYNNQ
jgi:hypothetical protein